ncbi:hypothetical protein ACFL6Y_11335 [Elusimicrobiota bacterium]
MNRLNTNKAGAYLLALAITCGIGISATGSDIKEQLQAIAEDGGIEILPETKQPAPGKVLPPRAEKTLPYDPNGALPGIALLGIMESSPQYEVLITKSRTKQGKPLSDDKAKGSYFAQLNKLYDNGKLPTKQELKGWFTGRCFDHGTPDYPTGNLLVGDERMHEADSGPLFPPRLEFRICSIDNNSASPDFFDEITPGTTLKIMQVLGSIYSQMSIAEEADNSLASKYKGGEFEFRVRKYKSYFVMRATRLTDTVDDKGRIILKAGDAFSACYYFKKVHD